MASAACASGPDAPVTAADASPIDVAADAADVADGAAEISVGDLSAAEDAATTDVAGADTAPTDSSQSPAPPPGPTWQLLGNAVIDAQGHSLPLAVTVSAADRYLALRIRPATPAPNAPWCYGIDDVRLPDGTPWLEPLTGGLGAGTVPFGSQRALAQHGYGVFVLPNDGVSALPEGVLTFRVVLRDCRYDLPTQRVADVQGRGRYQDLPQSLVVEAAREPALAADAPLRLELRVAVATSSGYAHADLQGAAGWQAAWAKAQARFATAGVTLHLGRVAAFTAPEAIQYGPGKPAALDAAFDAALTALTDAPEERSLRFVPVVLVGCLVRDAPLAGGPQAFSGQTPRIPGGAPFGSSAGGVFIARKSCLSGGAINEGEALGDVLAHELGHYLGLLHTNTALGAQRAEPGVVDIMTASGALSAAAGFGPKQRAALRRHFSLTVP